MSGPAAAGPSADRPFVEEVRDALAHLHDPHYLQKHPLVRWLGSRAPGQAVSGKLLRRTLVEAIEALDPGSAAPAAAPARRRHELMRLRYLEGLDIPAVYQKLAIGRSLYFREHGLALAALAAFLHDRPAGGSRIAELVPLPARAAPALEPTGTLPVYLTSFVGRQAEMADVVRLLGRTRLLTLSGAGGCGKTRLAVHAAATLAGAYPAGAWFVDLAPLADPALVPQAALAALGLREPPGRTPVAAIADYLGGRAALLVLDNCEHLVGACAHLTEALLRSCARLRVLATSREPLGAAGEAVYPVPPLAVPGASGGTEALAACASVRLFVERARAVRPDFVLDGATAPAVAEICRRLDGLPLALELAAAWVRTLSVGEIAVRLGDAVGLLTLGGRTVPARHRTLRAALDWSHELLTDAERTLLRRLSVFAGGCTLEAAGAVWAGAEGKGSAIASLTREPRHPVTDTVLEALDGLVAKSLLRARPDGRYGLLEPVRQYAAEKLLATGEAAAVRDCHRDYYLALAEQAAGAAPGPIGRAQAGNRSPDRAQVDGAWLERLHAEHDNLRTALGWCVERGDAEPGLRLVAALGDFWHALALNREGSAWARAVLALPRPSGASKALADALVVPAGLAWWLDALEAPDAIRGAVQESLAIGRELDDPAIVVRALRLLGQVQADPEETRRLFAGALEEAQRSGLIRDALWSRQGLACATFRAGDLAAARAMYEENLRLAGAMDEEDVPMARAQGYLREIGASLEWLGNIALKEGDAVAAEPLYREALAAFLRAPDRFGETHALQGLGLCARAQGEEARARALLTECLQLQRAIDDWQWLDGTLEGLAGLGDPVDAAGAARAIRLAGAASAIRRRFSTPSTPGERGWVERWLTPARDLLGVAASAAAWAEGGAMTPEHAIAYALSHEA
ncbi:MAG TPA: tetratricopeptide repeat protein [Chloroflexota bacterium]